ncbi:hypothetical protein F4775DRAFT_593216 [Biscogniauxia sp. FL1348]|nr:hypothetical protein F4775DRAFT_593216 [Biscogniauxia sp. FL1348]
MTSQPQPQIFTLPDTNGQDVRFPLFPQLPTELRLKIWQLSLERQRLIKVHLISRAIMDLLIAHRNEEPDSHDKNSPYCAIVDGTPMRSKLLRVCVEARQQALAFYRVRIPCRFASGNGFSLDETTAPGTLYFNPEHDFLHVSQQTHEFARFVYDLRTRHDPRHVGLRNLAVDSTGLTGSCGLCLLDPGRLEPGPRAELAATLQHLREVFFVSVQAAGRQTHGVLGGAPTNEFAFNRAFPVMAAPAPFERLARDPRPIADHLRRVLVNSDPRPMLRDWRRLLASFGVSPPQTQTQHRFLLAYEPSPRVGDTLVRSRAIAEGFLTREQQTWSDVVAAAKAAGRDVWDGDGETAFGFWLFPVDFLDGIPQTQTVVNLTQHWPELGLVRYTDGNDPPLDSLPEINMGVADIKLSIRRQAKPNAHPRIHTSGSSRCGPQTPTMRCTYPGVEVRGDRPPVAMQAGAFRHLVFKKDKHVRQKIEESGAYTEKANAGGLSNKQEL